MIAGIKQVHLVDVHIAAGEGKVETISTELLDSLLGGFFIACKIIFDGNVRPGSEIVVAFGNLACADGGFLWVNRKWNAGN